MSWLRVSRSFAGNGHKRPDCMEGHFIVFGSHHLLRSLLETSRIALLAGPYQEKTNAPSHFSMCAAGVLPVDSLSREKVTFQYASHDLILRI